jgi:hypothetical protein
VREARQGLGIRVVVFIKAVVYTGSRDKGKLLTGEGREVFRFRVVGFIKAVICTREVGRIVHR